MEEDQKRLLCQQLDTVDASMLFIGLLTLATALSWRATAIQREGLCRILLGEAAEVPDVFPLRLTVSGIVVGALTYFFLLSLDNRCAAQSQGAVARRSADMNVWASLLVLAAALIRLCDLNFVRRCGENGRIPEEAAEEELLPG